MNTVRITDAGGNKPTFVQWDVDRVLYVSGVASQPCLHFANAELKRAIVVQATDDNGRWKCLVPNFILQFACRMVVSVFVQPDEGRTVATAVYEVKPKLKPQDYSYEENIGYINWVAKSEEVQDLIDTIQGMLDSGELKGDPFTYDDFTEEQLAALKGDPGDDGVSPTVSTEVTYYGNKVTFTDADGDHTINVLDGMTATVKSALLNLFQHVAYVDDQGQTYYDALYDAFNPVLNVDYITVVFDPGTAVIYNTDELASLKPYITCTAHYDDGTSAVVDTYTLSGTLAAGTDTITVTYGGKSAIFTVTVAEWLVSIDAVFTQGSAKIYDNDTLDTLEQYLVVTATYADSTTATVTDYTLSGTLEVGTSTITASYGGKTDTFSATITSHVLYSLENQSVSTGDYIVATNTYGISEVDDTTILLDCTFTSLPTSGNGSTVAILAGWCGKLNSWGIRIGKLKANSNVLTGRWMTDTTAESMSFGSLSVNTRNRFAIVHEANSKTVTVYYKQGSGTKASWTRTATDFGKASISLGSQANGASSMCAGTVALFKVSVGISSAELDAFFA